MNAIIGGEKPVASSVQGVTNATQTRPVESFIVGYRAENTVVERVLTGDDTNDLDLLVASFVLVLKGAGFDVNLAVNSEGDFVIEDDSEVIEVEVDGEQLEFDFERPLQVGDKVEVLQGECRGITGAIGTIVQDDGDGCPLVRFPGWLEGHGEDNNEWYFSERNLMRVTTN